MKKIIKLTEGDISNLINEVIESVAGNNVITIKMDNIIEDLVFEFCDRNGMNESVARTLIDEVKEAVSKIFSNAIQNFNFLNR